MAAPGDVVFQQGLDEDSDVWDDSALIKAYDQAVKHVKKQLATELGDEVVSDSQQKDGNKKNKKKKGKAKHSKGKKKEPVWLVGSRCRAVFTDDGQIYEAVIDSIDRDAGTCCIRYLGYGNEEEQDIKDLMLPSKDSTIHSDAESMEWIGQQASPKQRSHSGASTPRNSTSRQHSRHPGQTTGTNPPEWAWSGAPSFLPPFLGGIPPPLPPMPASFPFMPPNIPQTPPPPPVADIDDLENDSDALHSMLIAWYLSGYHTGYYQGLKEARKNKKEGKINPKFIKSESVDDR